MLGNNTPCSLPGAVSQWNVVLSVAVYLRGIHVHLQTTVRAALKVYHVVSCLSIVGTRQVVVPAPFAKARPSL
jgi:hypothetical protein